MTDTARHYRPLQRPARPSPVVRLPVASNRAGDRLSARGWGSPKHCDERIAQTPDWLRDCLSVLHDAPERRATLVRRCMVALSDEPDVTLTDDLLRRLLRTDAEADVRLTTAMVDGITTEEWRRILPSLRMKYAVLGDTIRAGEALLR